MLFLETSGLQLQENLSYSTGASFSRRAHHLDCLSTPAAPRTLARGAAAIARDPNRSQDVSRNAAIVAAICYDGVGMVEFKWNRTTMSSYSSNSTPGSGDLCLAVASGRDFPCSVPISVHRERSLPQHFRLGCAVRNWTWTSIGREQRTSRPSQPSWHEAVVGGAKGASKRLEGPDG